MQRFARTCLLACLAFPVYFGAKRIPYVFGFDSYDHYMNRHYGFEGWPMHEYVMSHVPKGSRIWFAGSIPVPPKFYWLDYDVFGYSERRPCDYILMIKQNWELQRDGSWKNTYFTKMNVTLPALSGKVWETDRAILYKC